MAHDIYGKMLRPNATPGQRLAAFKVSAVVFGAASMGLGLLVENFDIMLHRSGSASTTDIPGLDNLVSLTPTVGTVGGIDTSVAANAFWRNRATTGLASNPRDAMSRVTATASAETRCQPLWTDEHGEDLGRRAPA